MVKITKGVIYPLFGIRGPTTQAPFIYFILLRSDFTVTDLWSKSEKSRPTDFKIGPQKGGQISS